MKLTIYNNNKLTKTTEHPELKRLYECVGGELLELLKGYEYEGIKSDITLYNSFEELKKKLSVFGQCHVATLKTENEKIDFFINK